MKTYFTLTDFDFTLPDELIAQHPAAERSASRLLDGRSAIPVDRRFAQLPELLQPGDLLVLNDTKVGKARLYGQKASGGRLELLIERVLSPSPESGHEVAAHIKVSKKPLPGAVMQMVGGFSATLLGRWPNKDGPLYHFALLQHNNFIAISNRAESVGYYNTGATASPQISVNNQFLLGVKCFGIVP